MRRNEEGRKRDAEREGPKSFKEIKVRSEKKKKAVRKSLWLKLPV